jgi:hypothetical protein
MTHRRHSAYSLFRRKMPFSASRRWSRCRPEADIGASVGSAIYLRDQGSCLTDNFGGFGDVGANPSTLLNDVHPLDRSTSLTPTGANGWLRTR